MSVVVGMHSDLGIFFSPKKKKEKELNHQKTEYKMILKAREGDKHFTEDQTFAKIELFCLFNLNEIAMSQRTKNQLHASKNQS